MAERDYRHDASGLQASSQRHVVNRGQSGLSSDRDDVRHVAAAFGNSEDELRSIPAEAKMGCRAAIRLRPPAVLFFISSLSGHSWSPWIDRSGDSGASPNAPLVLRRRLGATNGARRTSRELSPALKL